LLLNNGFSIELVAKVLGHANIATTQAVYAKILNSTLDKAFAKFGKKIKKRG
jgi:site-specific recombinase XerD